MTSPAHNADEVRELANSFLRRTGMAPADFARRIGYHYSTFNHFQTNTYRRGPGSKESNICDAIMDFIGSSASAVGLDEFTGKLYEIGNVKAMRTMLAQAVEQPCILMVYAPPGSGKTDTARALAPSYSTAAVSICRVYCRAGISKRDLMRRIAIACGAVADLSIERTISNLRFDYAGRRVVLVLDEAQHLSIECLEIVRELYDELQWSLIITGSHQLDRIFTKWQGELEQLERRVTDKVILPAVTAEEAANIVRSEIPNISTTRTKRLIELAWVDIRSGERNERFLSIGRLMGIIRSFERESAQAKPAENVEVIA
jgi:hypothetical protein